LAISPSLRPRLRKNFFNDIGKPADGAGSASLLQTLDDFDSEEIQ
jgi:hypothetical protein